MSKNTDKVKVTTLEHENAGVFDPVHIIDHEEPMLLLESADIITKLGEKSLLYFDLALKIMAKDGLVHVSSLTDEAKPVLLALKNGFNEQLVDSGPSSLTIKIEPLYHHQDLLEKMAAPSALDVLRLLKDTLEFSDVDHQKNMSLAGVFSYDFLDHFEKLPEPKTKGDDLPDFLFYLPLSMVLIDHKNKKTKIFAHSFMANASEAQETARKRLEKTRVLINEKLEKASSQKTKEFATNTLAPKYDVDVSDQEFYDIIEKCKSHINKGDVYQIVPSRVFSCPIKDPTLSYQALRFTNASPYMFYVHTKDWTLFGASPETFIKVEENLVSIRPIAGTRRRGFFPSGLIDPELDSREQASLCLDEKELAEHMMLVDLARNDIASVSQAKSRRVKRLLSVDRFSHVMHLVSEVEGDLKEGFDCLSAYQASMNMGTLMGAPKVRAAELLRELEQSKRGFYGGAVGYIDFFGNMDTAIIIRSALVKGNVAKIRTGCGVVYDSTPEFEAQETVNKAEAVLKAIEIAGKS